MLEETGEQGGHASEPSRGELQRKHEGEYTNQGERIRMMDVRAVAVDDQAVQTVFEI